MIKINLTNTGEHNPDDYVALEFLLDEDTPWMEIINKVLFQGLPALQYVIPDTQEEVYSRLLKESKRF